MKLQADISTIEIVIHLLIWFVLSIITLGIALLFFPYGFSKFIINNTSVVDDSGNVRRMSCNTHMFSNIGHIILWAIISIITLGLGYVLYIYKVWNYSINTTTID